jgi:hypothetical protein
MSSIFVTGRTYLGLVRPHWKLSASAGLCWRQSSGDVNYRRSDPGFCRQPLRSLCQPRYDEQECALDDHDCRNHPWCLSHVSQPARAVRSAALGEQNGSAAVTLAYDPWLTFLRLRRQTPRSKLPSTKAWDRRRNSQTYRSNGWWSITTSAAKVREPRASA